MRCSRPWRSICRDIRGSVGLTPRGGFFVWLTLPEFVDTRELFPRAVERQVAYVVGQAFFVDGSGRNTMRLSFSEPSPELIREGIRRLAGVIEEEITVAPGGAVS